MPDRVGPGRLHRERDARVALEVAQLPQRAEGGEHHLVAVEPDPHAAHLRRAVGVHRDHVGQVRTFEDLASGVGEGDHPGRVERRRCRFLPRALDALRRVVGEAEPRDGSRRGRLAHGGLDRSLARGRRGGRAPDGAPRRCAASSSLARELDLALVPQGGNTGLVGGATPRFGDVVVDLRRLDQLEAVDVAAGQVTVGAGVTLSQAAAPRGSGRPPARRGPRRAGPGDDRRDGRDQRRRHARAAPRLDAGAGARGGGRARHGGRRAGQPRRAAQGQHRLRPARPALRQRRAPSASSPGPGSAWCRCPPSGSSPSWRSSRSPMRSASLPALRGRSAVHAVEVMLAGGHRRPSPSTSGTPFPLAPVPACVLLVEVAGDDPLPELGAILARLDLPDDATVVADDDRSRRSPVALARGAPRGRRDPRRGPQGRRHRAARRDGRLRRRGRAAPSSASRPVRLTLVYGHLADGNLHVNIVGPAADDDRADATRCSSSCSGSGAA